MQFDKHVKERLKIVSQRAGFSQSCSSVVKDVTLGRNYYTPWYILKLFLSKDDYVYSDRKVNTLQEPVHTSSILFST
jgi:hypothetical protein